MTLMNIIRRAFAQFGRPSADTFIGTWTDDGGGTTNIYTTIDETSASDVDYIESVQAPSSTPYVTALTTLEDPVSSTGHIVRVRYGKDAAGGSQINLDVELRQGYVNEGTPGTLIASWSYTDISDTLTTASETLTGPQADSITDYSDLALRFVANQV